MTTKKKEVAGGKEYKGSAANGGRKIIVEHYKDSKGKWHTTSKNAAKLSTKRSTASYLKVQTLITRIITMTTIALVTCAH
jgi:hypothetical protein